MIELNDVIEYIETKNEIQLYEYQKEFLKHIIRGDTIYTPRCAGRSVLYNGYADYLKEKIAKSTDYSVGAKGYNKIFTYHDVVQEMTYQEGLFEELSLINPTLFEKEFNCNF